MVIFISLAVSIYGNKYWQTKHKNQPLKRIKLSTDSKKKKTTVQTSIYAQKSQPVSRCLLTKLNRISKSFLRSERFANRRITMLCWMDFSQRGFKLFLFYFRWINYNDIAYITVMQSSDGHAIYLINKMPIQNC